MEAVILGSKNKFVMVWCGGVKNKKPIALRAMGFSKKSSVSNYFEKSPSPRGLSHMRTMLTTARRYAPKQAGLEWVRLVCMAESNAIMSDLGTIVNRDFSICAG